MKMLSLCFVMVMCAASMTSAARILAVLPLDIPSHHFFCQPIVKELAIRGHQVTVITPIEDKNPGPNYKQILVPKKGIWDAAPKSNDGSNTKLEPTSFTESQNFIWNTTIEMTRFVLSSNEFQDFLANDKSTYDLLIYEIFFHEAFLMLGHKYNVPMVGLSTFGITHFINQFMGNPYELAYASQEHLDIVGRLNFWDRLRNSFWTSYNLYQRSSFLLPTHDQLAEQYFKNLPKPYPKLSDLEKNVSLVLLNSHFSIDVVRPNVPGIVEVGGVHIKPVGKLPKQIQKFMDSATDGVIYFSLGTNIMSSEMPKEYTQALLKVFGGLKQRVIWKWDDDQLAGKPDNVLLGKWFPQGDILGHPKTVLFITQGGALSTQESIARGVPMLCIPAFGDQFSNCAKSKHMEIAETLAFSEFNEERFDSVLKTLLTDHKYREAVIKLSVIFQDRPSGPLDTAMFWIEYTLRHKGARHMHSPAKELSWYEYYLLDISLVYALLAYFLFCILKWAFYNIALRKRIPMDEDTKALIEKHKAH